MTISHFSHYKRACGPPALQVLLPSLACVCYGNPHLCALMASWNFPPALIEKALQPCTCQACQLTAAEAGDAGKAGEEGEGGMQGSSQGPSPSAALRVHASPASEGAGTLPDRYLRCKRVPAGLLPQMQAFFSAY